MSMVGMGKVLKFNPLKLRQCKYRRKVYKYIFSDLSAKNSEEGQIDE
jgi:hypothetical protein